MLFAGMFTATVVENNAAVNAAGIISYNPSTDSFNSNFGGGVYKTTSNTIITILESTPLWDCYFFTILPNLINFIFSSGMYAGGDFNFVGHNFTYSGGVLQIIDDKYQGNIFSILSSSSLSIWVLSTIKLKQD